MSQKQKVILTVAAIVFVGGIAFLSLAKVKGPQPANISAALEKKAVEIQREVQKENEQLPREINIKAFQFGYEPSIINVAKGEKIKIIIENTDVLHGIRIPDLGLRGDEVLEFTADRAGEFTWYCTNMCGEGHKSMQGKLIIE